MTTPLPSAVCVLGMGLIGGSLMRAAAPHVPVFGWSPGDGTRTAASADGFDVAGRRGSVAHDAIRWDDGPAYRFATSRS